jgi:hypothetical protein
MLHEMIAPLPRATYECDTTWDRLDGAVARMAENYGILELNPDFQRGHLWTGEQQSAFIENCLSTSMNLHRDDHWRCQWCVCKRGFIMVL